MILKNGLTKGILQYSNLSCGYFVILLIYSISRFYYQRKPVSSTVQLRYGVSTFYHIFTKWRKMGQWDFRRHCSGSAAADLESTTRPAFRDTCLGPKEQ